MKTKLFLSALVLVLMQMMSLQVNAQTSVTIQQFSDSTFTTYCPPPVNVYLYTYGQTTGYNINDSVTVQIDFGDGTTYTNKTDISQNWFWDAPVHAYLFSGIFSLRCIVTGPDLKADTAFYSIVVGDTCGNVNGILYMDANSDCQYNTGEALLAGIPVTLKQNNTVIATSYTDNNGEYNFSVPIANTYDIVPSPNIFNYGFSVVCPVAGQYTNVIVPANAKDFGLSCLSGFDLQTSLSGWMFRPGFDGHIYPLAYNTYCAQTSGQLELILDPLTHYVTANPLPTSVNGDTLRWNFNNLSNSSNGWYWYGFNPQVTVNTDLAAQIGDTVCFQTTVTPTTGDINTANNIFNQCYAVSNSWDPNMKEVSPRGFGPTGDLLPGIHTMNYTIHFQNTGSDTAYNIFVLDTLSANLDLSTFQIISSSHQMEADILPFNVVKFSFNNIMLVDSSTNEPLSKGRVSYTIRTKAGIPTGSQIKNTANIYFDYNPAVVTNTTLNTIGIHTGIKESVSENYISIYPNPATDRIEININTNLIFEKAYVTIYNLQGQKIMQQLFVREKSDINVSKLAKGIYFVKVSSNNNSFVDMFVKE